MLSPSQSSEKAERPLFAGVPRRLLENGEDIKRPFPLECLSSGESKGCLNSQGLEADLREKPRVDGVFKSLDRPTFGVEKGDDWGLLPEDLTDLTRGLGASITRVTSLCE